VTIDSLPKSDVLQTLLERGFIHQCTDVAKLDEAFRQGTVAAYVGYDCTADSLHVGSLVSIMMLKWLQHYGHQPIVLMGGGTTKVGDPSGKDEARKLLSDADIAHNLANLSRIFAAYLRFGDQPSDAVMVNNDRWLSSLHYISFLRDYGRHFSVNRMLSFDSVKLRLEREQPLSFLEFNYMILQAYDFVELAKQYRCQLQIGGADQWGNIVNGIELGRRTAGLELFGLTCPLLTTSSGAKMGKTADGAVWLNADKLSPYAYWQYWRNVEDADVLRFLKLFTMLPMDDIEKLGALQGAEVNEAKKILATEVTALCHGAETAQRAAESARTVFEQGQSGAELPTVIIAAAELKSGLTAFQLLVRAGLATSNSEARKLIAQKGAKLNGETIVDEKMLVTESLIQNDGTIKLMKGKKSHVLVKIS
jgi:tyrosyl-tRNA synthetase